MKQKKVLLMFGELLLCIIHSVHYHEAEMFCP